MNAGHSELHKTEQTTGPPKTGRQLFANRRYERSQSVTRRAERSLCLLALAAAGCATATPYTWVDDLSAQAFEPAPYRINVGDLISVSVWNQANLSAEARVRPDGMVTLPLLGDIPVAGLTPPSCASQVQRRLDGLVLEPKVTVSLREAKTPAVSVVGEVRQVGEYPLNGADNVVQVLARAGGLTEFAQPDHIYVLRREPKPLRVRFTYNQLTRGAGRGLSFRLRDGDILIVE